MIENALTELVYPIGITCIICDRDLQATSRYAVCSHCKLTYITKFCECCGNEIIGAKAYCDSCLNKDRSFNMARAPFYFHNDNIKKIVYGLKYGDKTYFAQYMAEFMTDVFVKTGWEIDIVTYVPIHRKKLRYVRGYNQAQLLAESFCKINELEVTPLLKKLTYNKKSTASMSKAARIAALADSFEILPNVDIKRKNILLIDDVFTTGSTVDTCAMLLKEHKASRVYVLTFATSREKEPLYDLSSGDKALIRLIKSKRLYK